MEILGEGGRVRQLWDLVLFGCNVLGFSSSNSVTMSSPILTANGNTVPAAEASPRQIPPHGYRGDTQLSNTSPVLHKLACQQPSLIMHAYLQQLDIFQGRKGFVASVIFAQAWPALDRELGEKS